MREILAFLNRMYRILNSTLNYVTKGKPIALEVGTGGSYTDGNKVHVGVSEAFDGLSPNIVYMMTVALIGHEGQHVLSSNFIEFERYNQEETRKLTALGVSERFAAKLVHAIGNIVEDGRIENILVNRLPGFIPKIQYLNMFFWNRNQLSEKTDELTAFINAILSLSILGIYPKNYHIFEGSRVDAEVSKVKDLIKQGVVAVSCKEGLDVAREILRIIQPFILEMYQQIKQEEQAFQELMDLLGQLLQQHENCEEEEYNDSQNFSSHLEEKKQEQKKGKFGSGRSVISEEESEDSEEESEGSSSQEGKDSKKTNPKKGGSKKEKKEEAEEGQSGSDKSNSSNEDKQTDKKEGSSESGKDEGSEAENGDGKESSNKKSDKKENSNKDDDNKSSEYPDGQSEDNNTRQLSRGLEGGEGLALSDGDVEERMKELARQLVVEAEKDIIKSERDEKNAKRNQPLNYNLSPEEIRLALKDDEGYPFIEIRKQFSIDAILPGQVQVAANKFKRQIRDIFNSKAIGSVIGQEKGTLDTDSLFRVGMKNYNVFKTETPKNVRQHVLFILRDGSGSMHGEKDRESMLSLAIIEEGLKDVVPFKAVTFNTTGNAVQHIVIKDWNDKSKRNYAFNYIRAYSASGGNVDSASIRIAVAELLKRPEKDKTLIVLSDGLPDSRERTKVAIKHARNKGINVIGIMFGDESFRIDNLPDYKDMYQKNIIATRVDKIANQLTLILKETLKC